MKIWTVATGGKTQVFNTELAANTAAGILYVTEHDVHPPEQALDSLEMIMIENVSTCDGKLEVDVNAIVSWGEDPGAYVQTWSWVSFDSVDQDMAIIMPDETVWYFDQFDQFMEAWSMTPKGAVYQQGTPDLLYQSGGINDAAEFEAALYAN